MQATADTGIARARSTNRAAGLIAVMALVTMAWCGCLEPAGQVRVLPDGSRLELRGWTYGKKHTFVDGSGWQRLAAGIPALAPLCGGFHRTWNSPAEVSVLWFRVPDSSVLRSCEWAAPIDQHGCGFRPEPDNMGRTFPILGFDLRRGERSAVLLPVFPRRGKGSFRFAVMAQYGKPPLVEFTVPNPTSGEYPVWQASPCPVVVSRGDTAFTLDALKHHRLTDNAINQSTATFSFRGSGPAARNWHPERITVSDATGNHLTSIGVEPDLSRSITFDGLCRYESAWKLRVRFARADPRAAPADLVCEIPAVPAPEKGKSVETDLVWQRPGVRLRLARVHGRARATWPGGDESYHTPGVTLFVSSAQPWQITLARVEDERGRSWPAAGAGKLPEENYVVGSEEEQEFDLPDTPGARRLRLTFALHRPRTVEFLVRP